MRVPDGRAWAWDGRWWCRELDGGIGVSATFGFLGAVLCHLAGAGWARMGLGRALVVSRIRWWTGLGLASLRSSWACLLGHLGPVLGFSWVILGLSCLIFWPLGSCLGSSWASLGSSWACFASSWGAFGCRELDREIGVLVTFGLLGAVLGPVGSLAFGFHGSPCSESSSGARVLV